MIVFGGEGNEQVCYLDLNTFLWKRIENIEFEREGHTANLIGENVYLFGGTEGWTYENDLFSFDVTSHSL